MKIRNRKNGARRMAAALALAAFVVLAGCTNEPNNAPEPSETPVETVSPEPTLTPSETPSAQPPASDDADAGEGAGQDDGVEAVNVGTLVELAKEGKVPGCDYAAHTALYDEIEQKWGKADKNDTAGKGVYAVYNDRHMTFGYNKGMIVFDVRSNAPELQKLTLNDIEKAIGKADATTTSGGDKIYTYQVNDQFQLKFAIPESTGLVDHISVYSPEDTKNNMAG